MSRKLIVYSLVLLVFSPFCFGKEGDQSFHLWVGPRYFENESFGLGDEFSEPGFPEVGFRTGFLQTNFLLEPLFSASFLRKKSKTTAVSDTQNRKSTLSLLQLGLGARQSFWSSSFFPLSPYVESLLTYHIAFVEQKLMSGSTEAKSDFNGSELGLRVGGGLQFSFSETNPALKSEIENVWEMTDYGLDLHAYYYLMDFLRSGDFDDLPSIKSYAFGGGLYFRW